MKMASFYCYLNYDSKKDFVINFTDVWKWCGFSRKDHAKVILNKHFVEDIDYKINKAAPATSGKPSEVDGAKKDNFPEVAGKLKVGREKKSRLNASVV
jgi:hypothetical protein